MSKFFDLIDLSVYSSAEDIVSVFTGLREELINGTVIAADFSTRGYMRAELSITLPSASGPVSAELVKNYGLTPFDTIFAEGEILEEFESRIGAHVNSFVKLEVSEAEDSLIAVVDFSALDIWEWENFKLEALDKTLTDFAEAAADRLFSVEYMTELLYGVIELNEVWPLLRGLIDYSYYSPDTAADMILDAFKCSRDRAELEEFFTVINGPEFLSTRAGAGCDMYLFDCHDSAEIEKICVDYIDTYLQDRAVLGEISYDYLAADIVSDCADLLYALINIYPAEAVSLIDYIISEIHGSTGAYISYESDHVDLFDADSVADWADTLRRFEKRDTLLPGLFLISLVEQFDRARQELPESVKDSLRSLVNESFAPAEIISEALTALLTH